MGLPKILELESADRRTNESGNPGWPAAGLRTVRKTDSFGEAAKSVFSNEDFKLSAKAGATKKDFLNFYAIALKSANETKYWLCLIRDSIQSDRNKVGKLLQEADELSKIIASIIISVKQG